jgi:predicted nucleotidyltransferase
MPYTEIIARNTRKYYYRVISIRKGVKVSKKKIYLGAELSKSDLAEKENAADRLFSKQKATNELERIKSNIIKILKDNKVTKAGIFGSYSRGEQRKDSDIDIVVNIQDKQMSLIGFIRLIKLLESALKKKVDLVEYNSIKPRIRETILNEEIRII